MNLYFEMTFSLPSPLSLLKLPILSEDGGGGGGGGKGTATGRRSHL